LLLTAVSLGRTALGLTLVAAFSLGLALLVTAVGTAVVLFGDRLRRLPGGGLFSGILPVISAVIVTLLGLGLTIEGLRDLFGGGA
jgi:ABC-type nickel/cobalt efflux system permease component RcnA